MADMHEARWFTREEQQPWLSEPTLKGQWIAALRSGDFRQIRSRVTDHNGGFCAVGVLYHISTESQTMLDAWLGSVLRQRIVDMNDCEQRSFAQIADYIAQRVL